MSTQDGHRPRVVVFGANGGIGQNVAHALARQMNDTGQECDVCLVTRQDDKGTRANIGQGVAREVRETFPDAKVDLGRAFADAHHVMWDEKNPEGLRATLEGADTIIVAAGVPRKLGPDGKVPQRAELVSQNAPAALQIGKIIGKFAPAKAPVINCMNPADNAGGIIENACKKEWDERGVPADERPVHKVLTMGGTLDESRLRLFLADRINKELAAQGDETRVLPVNVEGIINGQHGPKMVIDRESILIKDGQDKKPLSTFLADHGLSDKEETIVTDVSRDTINAGADLNKLLGRSAQTSPAERMAEIAMAAMFSDKPYTLTGAVMHDWNDDNTHVASGVRVDVSKAGISINQEWLNHAMSDPILAGCISESRVTIAADQAAYDMTKIFREHDGDMSRSRTPSGEKITIELRNVPPGKARAMAALLERGLELGEGAVRHVSGSPASITFPANPVFEALVSKADVVVPTAGRARSGGG